MATRAGACGEVESENTIIFINDIPKSCELEYDCGGTETMKHKEHIPSYLQCGKTVSAGNIDVGDQVWIGPNDDVDPGAVLQEHGHDPDDPLSIMLKSIIAAHPLHDDARNNDQRLATALDALVGKRRKRGMVELDGDYVLLIEIARKYFESFHRHGQTKPRLAGIIREIITKIPEGDARKLAVDDSVVRRLTRKFRQHEEVLLVRISSEQDWDRMDVTRRVNAVIDGLSALGIPVRRT